MVKKYTKIVILSIILSILFSGCSFLKDEIGHKVEHKFISTDPKKCETLNFTCKSGEERFDSEYGCGCQAAPDVNNFRFCSEIEKANTSQCSNEIEPVCGYFSGKFVQCISEPCVFEYRNKCFACQDPTLAYFIEGSCPKKD